MREGQDSLHYCNGDDWQRYSNSLLSFFLNSFNIAAGVLIYIAQAFCVGGSIVGASAYFKSKWMEFDTRADNVITSKINEIVNKFEGKDKDKDK